MNAITRLAPLALLLLLLPATPARATSLSLEPSALLASPGETIFLDLVISDLGSDVVGDVDVELLFDPAALTFGGYTLSDALGDVGLGAALDFSLGEAVPGAVDLAVVSTLATAQLAGIQMAPFALATFEFSVAGLTPGASTQVALVLEALGDGAGVALPATSVTGASITAVPEPAALVLLATGLGGLALRRRAAVRR